MRIAVGKPLRVGEITVATLTGQEINTTSAFGFASLSGRKFPLAVLVHMPGKATALHLNGEAMTVPELKALCGTSPDAKKALADFDFRL